MKKKLPIKKKQIPLPLKTIFLLLCISIVFTFSAGAGQQGNPGEKGPKPVGAVNSSNGGVWHWFS